MKIILLLWVTIGCTFANNLEKPLVWNDDRFPTNLRKQFQHMKFTTEYATKFVAMKPTLELVDCLAVDKNKILNPKEDSGPFASLIFFKDNLCLDRTRTLTCYNNYLDDLSLATEHEEKAEILKPLRITLNKICDQDGNTLKTVAKNVLDCIERKFSNDSDSNTYTDCYAKKTGPKLQNPVIPGGIVPYYYSFSCRTIPQNKKCAHQVSEYCGLSTDEHNFIDELFAEIKNTPVCLNDPVTSQQSYTERVFQYLEIEECLANPNELDAWKSFGACSNITEATVTEVTNDLTNKNISNSLMKLCPNLPTYKNCMEEHLERATACHINDYRHFNMKGYQPLLHLADFICNGNGTNIDALVQVLDNECLPSVDFESISNNCTYGVIENWRRNSPQSLLITGYMDYEMFEDAKQIKTCLVKEFSACGPRFTTQIADLLDVLINALNANVINYN